MEIEQNLLERHAYMWIGDGPTLSRDIAIGYARLPGLKAAHDIFLNNYGLPERPDWVYTIRENQKIVWTNKHFKSAAEAYTCALEWLALTDHRPRPRLFEWFDGHVAYVVDGLEDCEAIIVERVSGEWWLQTTLDNGRSYWMGPWGAPFDALTV